MSFGIHGNGFYPYKALANVQYIIEPDVIKLDCFDGLPRDGVTLLACIRPFDTSRENDKRS